MREIEQLPHWNELPTDHKPLVVPLLNHKSVDELPLRVQ